MSDRRVNEMCQLIFYDFSLNEDIEKHLVKNNFDKLGLNYNTISIIGPQSSGKSTLLNKLFNTNFDVMSTDRGRGQTTKGIWLASHTESKTLILDCEGTDSKERGETRCKFEHTSALFCMALSDVLIINMWTSDVGRYTASNYGVLKIVFETNLKLFQQECDKKILIILRDFEERRHKKDKIEELILNDINNIWTEIKKPERFANSTPKNFFKFEFITLPHKVYCPKDFDAEVGKLRLRLEPGSEDYIFSHIVKEKNIPSDGLMQYFKQIWSEIQNEKDLNIPTQKEMLADYRCNEIKTNILTENESKIRDFLNLATLNDIANFKEQVNELSDAIVKQYETTANNYLEERFKHYRSQLINYLSERFHIAFVNQTKRLIPISQKFFRNDLEKALKENENFAEVTQKTKAFYLKTLVDSLERKRAFESWKISKNDYEELFNEIIENLRKHLLEEKKTQTIKTLKKQIDECINNILNDLQGDFWFTFNQDYFTFYTAKMFSLKTYLEEYYGMDHKEFVGFCEYIENQVYESIKNCFSKKIQEISQIAVEYFKKRFWYEENGEAKIWSKYEDDVIDSSYKKLRSELMEVFETFRYLKTFKNPLKFFDYTNNSEQNLDTVLEKVKSELAISNLSPDTFEILLKTNQISVVKKKFDEGISDLLEDAKRRKGSIFDNNLPWYGWVLLIFFGYDDLFNVLFSWKIIFVIIIASGYFALWRLNKIYLLKNFYFEVENFIVTYRKQFIGR